MPMIAIVAVIAAASMSAAMIAAGVAVVTAIAIGVAVAATMAIMSSAMNPSVPKFNSGDQGTSLGTASDPKTVLPIIYGESRTGTVCVYKDVATQGKRADTHLVQIFAVAEGEIDSFRNLYMDNKQILVDGTYRDGIVPENNFNPLYKGYVQIEFSTGKNPGYHLSLARKYLGDKWPVQNTGNGVATICIVMQKTVNALNNGVDVLQPNSQVAVDIKGRLITDLVTGQRTPSRNGPSQIIDYLTNTKYGLGVPLEQIDLDSFKTVAAQTVSYYSDGSTDPNATFKKNLTDICAAFGAVIFDNFGKITCKLDAPDVIKYTFDEDNITNGQISFKDGETAEYYNTLNVAYFDPEIDYASNVLRYPSNPNDDPLIAKDKRIISKDLTFRFVKDPNQIDKLASVERNKCKLNQQMSFSTADAYTLQVWDVIKVSFDELQLKDSLWRVTGITPNLQGGMAGNITVQCVEYNSVVYTDMDFAAKPDNTPSSISSSISQPYNLAAVAVGETVYGKSILLTWDADEDFNRYRFFIQYKQTTSTDWLDAGATGQFQFTITGLKTGVNYDYRVCAAGLFYQSPWTELLNQNPAISYDLPAPVVRLRNAKVVGGLETEHDEFFFEWDDQHQSDVTINGKTQKFSDLFDYYQVNVTTNNKTVQYRTYDLHWAYTYAMNVQNGLSRNVRVGVTAVGYGGMKSTETVLDCFNAQCVGLKGFTATAGFNAIFTQWLDPTELDFAGVIVQVATDAGFTQNLKVFQAPNAYEIHQLVIEDGKYYVRAGAYDVFGIDGVIYTAPVYVDLQSKVNWTNQDQQALEDFINLESRLDDAIDQAFERSKDALQVELSNLNTNIKNDYGQAITAAVTDLKTIVKDGDALVSTRLDQVKTQVDNDIAATVTNLNQAIASGDAAQASAIQVVKSELKGDVAQVSTEAQTKVDALKNTINASYTVKVNAGGVVTGMQMLADPANNKSAIYFNANEFYVISDSTNTASPIIPFAVQNNRVFINSAMIQNASIGSAQISDASIGSAKIVDGAITNAKIQNAAITNGKISGTLSSQNAAGWALYQDGSFTATKANITGVVNANGGVFHNVTIASNCDIQGTLTANKIVGDIAAQGILPACDYLRTDNGVWTTVSRQVYNGQGNNIIVSVPNVNCYAKGGSGDTTGGNFGFRVLVAGNVICSENITGGTGLGNGIYFGEKNRGAKTTMGGCIQLNNVGAVAIEVQIQGSGYVGSYPSAKVDAAPVIVSAIYRNNIFTG